MSTGTNGFGFIGLSILDNGHVEPTKEFDLVLSRADTGEVFRTLPISIADNELPIPVGKDPTFRLTANIAGSQVWVRPDGNVLLLDPEKLELHSLTASGSLEKTVVLAALGSFSTDYASPGLVEPTGTLLLNVNGFSEAGRLSLDSASSIVRVRLDGTIDRRFRIFGVHSSARALHVDAEGKILVGLDGWGDRTWLLRYLPDGTREASFEPRWLERIILSVAGPRADGRFNVIYRLPYSGDAGSRSPRPGILDLTREEASLDEVGAPREFKPAYLVTSEGWYAFDWSSFDLFGIEGFIKVSSDGRRVPEFFVPGYPFSSNPRLAAVQPDGKVLAFIEGEAGIGLVRFEARTSHSVLLLVGLMFYCTGPVIRPVPRPCTMLPKTIRPEREWTTSPAVAR